MLASLPRGAGAMEARESLVRSAFVLNSDNLGRRVVSGAARLLPECPLILHLLSRPYLREFTELVAIGRDKA